MSKVTTRFPEARRTDAIIAQMYREGWALDRLSRRYGVTRERIRHRLVRAGEQRRPPGRRREEEACQTN